MLGPWCKLWSTRQRGKTFGETDLILQVGCIKYIDLAVTELELLLLHPLAGNQVCATLGGRRYVRYKTREEVRAEGGHLQRHLSPPPVEGEWTIPIELIATLTTGAAEVQLVPA